MSIVGLCLIVLGTVFSFFGTYFSDKEGQTELTGKIQEKNKTIDAINASNVKLVDQNTALLSTTTEAANSNKDLISQNTDMLSKIAKYQNDIEQRNKEIDSLRNEVINVKQYSYYATLDIYGRDVIPGYGIIVSSDLIDRMKNILVEGKGTIAPKATMEVLPLINDVIRKYPNFPWGYYCKAAVYKDFNNQAWKAAADKAIEIFEVTTTIVGHHPSHDQALKQLKNGFDGKL